MERIEKILQKIENENKKNTIKMDLSTEIVGLIGSKLGGIPYISKNRELPKNSEGQVLRLLCQINLEELPKNNLLKNKGLLQFFIGQDDLYGMDFDDMSKQEDFRILYYDDIDDSVDKDEVVKKGYYFFDEEYYFPLEKELKIKFRLEEESISTADYNFEKLFLNEYNLEFNTKIDKFYDIENDVLEYVYDKNTSGSGHKIGGYPFFTQEDPRYYDDELKNYDTLLLQIDSDFREDEYEIIWGDCGVCNFFIKKEDLETLNFSNVIYNWDCY